MADLITEEPRDPAALVLAGGEDEPRLAYERHDGPDPEDPCRWWPLIGDDDTGPVTWEQVSHELILTGDGEWLWVPRPVIRLWRTGEEIEEVGGHRVVISTGRCICHGRHYDPIELGRMRQVPA